MSSEEMFEEKLKERSVKRAVLTKLGETIESTEGKVPFPSYAEQIRAKSQLLLLKRELEDLLKLDRMMTCLMLVHPGFTDEDLGADVEDSDNIELYWREFIIKTGSLLKIEPTFLVIENPNVQESLDWLKAEEIRAKQERSNNDIVLACDGKIAPEEILEESPVIDPIVSVSAVQFSDDPLKCRKETEYNTGGSVGTATDKMGDGDTFADLLEDGSSVAALPMKRGTSPCRKVTDPLKLKENRWRTAPSCWRQGPKRRKRKAGETVKFEFEGTKTPADAIDERGIPMVGESRRLEWEWTKWRWKLEERTLSFGACGWSVATASYLSGQILFPYLSHLS